MADLNKVFLAGNLTRDPEVRHIPSGQAVADLRMAINRRYRDQHDKDREEVVYVSVTVWGKQAETCGQYLTKGAPVLVEGRLKLDEWEKDGQKQSRLGVVAERVQFLSSRGGGSRSGGEFDDAPSSRAPSRSTPAAADRVPQEEILDDGQDQVPF
ncbi:MAG TPA: single-stranded DNA-binding protein [Kiritimatiellia bacterium]|nr:single-stranded DNA-binding protein [Kiritimatiellia bacterium]HMO98857.1 single-stranded DNA-binding protein [Kiritimatiellia bacterium]HMP97278.1 single-stranded DNA-binding protein [Kiritimatiellia bacterium]